MEYITEIRNQTPLAGSYDVVVSGGGIAGISAALAAARNGAKKVLLIDKNYGLGGLATLGLVTIFLPICDGMGHQVSFGICEELFRLSIKYGYEKDYPASWLDADSRVEDRLAQRFCVQYNANVFSILAEKLLISEGVELLYGTLVCDVICKENRVEAIVVENKTGRSAVSAKTFVDATGDCDLFKLAGAETALSGVSNPLAAWYYKLEDSQLCLVQLGVCDLPEDLKAENASLPLEGDHYVGIDADELTKMSIASHDALLKHYLKNGGVSLRRSLTSIASIPQIRMSRRINGVVSVCEEPFRHYADSIGMISNWKRRGPIFEIPFRSLYGKQFANLITAGRSISADSAMWDNTRVIGPSAVTGEAAGTAAALFDDFFRADVEKLQSTLRRNGVKLFISELEI